MGGVRMDLKNYIIKNYGYSAPVFLGDLTERLPDISPTSLRQKLKRLVDDGKINRFKSGIYFIPKEDSMLKKKTLSIEKVLEKKYLINNNKRIGYVTGLTFANNLQLTTQVPSKIEIVTTKEARTKRTVDYKNNLVILRKPRFPVNNNNYKLLQVLDLINKYYEYVEKPTELSNQKVIGYLKGFTITKKELNNYLTNYPAKTYKNLIESELYDEITQG